MGLPGRTEGVLITLEIASRTNLKMDLSGLRTELPANTLEGNMKFSRFKLEPVPQANNFKEIDNRQ